MQEEINNLAQALLYFSDVYQKVKKVKARQLVEVFNCLKQYIEDGTISDENLIMLKQLNLSSTYIINNDDSIHINYLDFV